MYTKAEGLCMRARVSTGENKCPISLSNVRVVVELQVRWLVWLEKFSYRFLVLFLDDLHSST